MSHKKIDTPKIAWIRLLLGAFFMVGMLYIYVYVKEFDILLFAIPAALMGVNPLELLKLRK